MIIKSKFESRCNKCHVSIPVGSSVVWERGVRGVEHVQCPVQVAPVNVTPTVLVPVPTVEGVEAISTFLTNAQQHIKFPKVRFLAPDGKSELRLSLAGSGSKYPGSVQVKVGGNWIGRINVNGTVAGYSMTTEVIDTLKRIALNPAQAAKEYGALMNRCSFCNLQLTDAESVEMGYGPICARHYGLPHTAKGTPAVKQVGEVQAEQVITKPENVIEVPEPMLPVAVNVVEEPKVAFGIRLVG